MLTKRTILVAIPPSFLPMTSSPLSDKFTLEGLTMLFRLQISLIPLLHTLSILKLSGSMLKLTHCQRQLKFVRYHENWTVEDWKRVLWPDGPKSITFGQIARYMSGNNRNNHYQIALQYLLLNMEGETILWCGVVWGRMELESLWRFKRR